jgi:cobalamin biosynthesis protein CobW
MTARSTSPRIPATIVTGFLGAGKTTLIRHLLAHAEGRRIGLIVNEFGDVGFDGDLLADCGSEACGRDDVIELSNGCICCTVADEFLPAMERLLERDTPPDHLVIETSGLALPQPLVKAFAWPTIRERVTIDGVVTVVDAEAVADGRMAPDEARIAEQREQDDSFDHESPIEELFEDQLRCADLIVLSKADLVDEDGFARVEAAIAPDRRPQARTVRSAHGVLPPLVLLGLGASAETDAESRRSHHELEGEEEHEHDDFTSFALRVEAPDRAAAVARIAAAMRVEGVLRIKGHVRIAEKAAPLAVQAVGARVEAWFRTDAIGDPRLVVIGLASLDRTAVEAALGAEPPCTS